MSKYVYVAWSNTDLTEGAGFAYPYKISRCEATVTRLGKGKDVQGTDCTVTLQETKEINGKEYIPIGLIYLEKPTQEDLKHQAKLDAYKAVIDKAKGLGLSDTEIKMLKGSFND